MRLLIDFPQTESVESNQSINRNQSPTEYNFDAVAMPSSCTAKTSSPSCLVVDSGCYYDNGQCDAIDDRGCAAAGWIIAAARRGFDSSSACSLRDTDTDGATQFYVAFLHSIGNLRYISGTCATDTGNPYRKDRNSGVSPYLVPLCTDHLPVCQFYATPGSAVTRYA